MGGKNKLLMTDKLKQKNIFSLAQSTPHFSKR